MGEGAVWPMDLHNVVGTGNNLLKSSGLALFSPQKPLWRSLKDSNFLYDPITVMKRGFNSVRIFCLVCFGFCNMASYSYQESLHHVEWGSESKNETISVFYSRPRASVSFGVALGTRMDAFWIKRHRWRGTMGESPLFLWIREDYDC